MSVIQGNAFSDDEVNTGDIGHSLRFRGAQYIATTLTTAATSTYFILFKQAKLGAINPLFDTNIKINANDTITAFGLTTTAVKRDPTGWHWMHVSNNGLVVDGVNLGAVTTSAITNPRLGFDGTNYANMYGARICCVSGTSLAYTDFVYFNAEINEWVVKSKSTIKALVDAGGSAGFMYEFDDATSLTTLGNDYSAKNNDGTLTGGFSLTAGTTYDHMLDVPGNSYATLNPLRKFAVMPDVKEGNLFADGSAYSSAGSMSIAATQMGEGKTYVEITVSATNLGGQAGGFGFVLPGLSLGSSNYPGSVAGGFGFTFGAPWGKRNNGGTFTNIALTGVVAGDVMSVAYDPITGNAWVAKNGVWNGTGNPSTGANPDLTGLSAAWVEPVTTVYRSGGFYIDSKLNFGQRPFSYTPPTGFKALCQANLPDVAAGVLSPKKNFDVMLATGANIKTTSESVFPSNFMEWIKDRTNSNNHQLLDIVRGTSAVLQSNTTGAETTYTAPAGNSVGWVWKAGGAPVSNTAGSITSQVSANVAAGFSIATYTGTGANATVGHGLGKAPGLVIVKNRGLAGSGWPVYHKDQAASPALGNMFLNLTSAYAASSIVWNDTAPTSSVFSVGTYTGTNGSGNGMVAYCFADIEGYSKAFSYTGNASADGVYVDLGFKPRWVLLKCSSTTGNWVVFDTTRDTYNVMGEQLYPNLSNAGSTVTTLDVTSRGFKARIATDPNSAQTFVGFAIADVAGKYSLGR